MATTILLGLTTTAQAALTYVDIFDPALDGYAAGTSGSADLAAGTATITASGRDIWDNRDGCGFLYAEFDAADEIDISCKVMGFTAGTNVWRKAGVMIRDTLDPHSVQAVNILRGGTGDHMQAPGDPQGGPTDRLVGGQWRDTYDTAMGWGDPGTGNIQGAYWVRLVKPAGSDVFSYYYQNGAPGVDPWGADGWLPVPVAATHTTPGVGATDGIIRAGLCVTSHDVSQITTANFTEIRGFSFEPIYWWDDTGNGNWSNAATRWSTSDPPPVVPPAGGDPQHPNADISARIVSDAAARRVTVNGDYEAYSLEVENSELLIGAGNRLRVGRTSGGGATFDEDSALLLQGGSFEAAYGSIPIVFATGTATIGATDGTLAVDGMVAETGAGVPAALNFHKNGAGTVSLTELEIDPAHLAGSSITVDQGILHMIGMDAFGGLDAVTLNGGIISAMGTGESLKTNTLTEWWFAGTFNDAQVGHASDFDDDYTLLNGIPIDKVGGGLDQALNFQGADMSRRGDYIFNNSLANPDDPEQVGMVIHGTLTVAAGGPVEPGDLLFFGLDSDDRSTAWFDENGDGDFKKKVMPLDQSEEITTDTSGGAPLMEVNNIEQVCYAPASAGDYKVAFAVQEGTGGQYIMAKWWAGTQQELVDQGTPNPWATDKQNFFDNVMHWVDPSDPAQAGLWKGITPDQTDLSGFTFTAKADKSSGIRAVSVTSAPVPVGELILENNSEVALSIEGFATDMALSKITLAAGAASAGITAETTTILPATIVNNFGGPATLKVGGVGELIARDGDGSGVAADLSFQVEAGGRLVDQLGPGGTNPIGDAAVTLDRATFRVEGADSLVDGLMGSLFRNTPDNETPVNLTGASYQEATSRVFTGNKANTILVQAEEAGYNTLVTSSTQCNNDNDWGPFPTLDSDWEHFVTAYSGRFYPQVDGSYNFHWDNDDAGTMFIDLADDGIFDAGDRVDGYAWNANGSVNLTVGGAKGDGYPVIYMAQEFGGGRTVHWYFTPPGGTEAHVDPGAQAGMWKTLSKLEFTVDNPITVIGDSVLEAVTAQAANFNTLALNNGILRVTDAVGGVTFTATTIGAGEGGTVGVDTQVDTTLTGTDPLQGPGDGVALTFRKFGGADLVLNKSSTAPDQGLGGTTFEVYEGRLHVKYGSDPLDGAPVVLKGGAFAAEGADTAVEGIRGSVFFAIARTEGPVNLDGATYQPNINRVFTGDKAGTILIPGAEDPNNNVVVTGSTQDWGAFPNFDGNADDFVTAFSGRFFPRVAGSYNFHWNNDDAGQMYIDMEDDGIFDATNRVATYAWNSNGNRDLVVGGPKGNGYPVIYMAQEYGGAQAVWWAMTEPGGAEALINPSDGRGTWKTLGFDSVDIRNVVTVDGRADGLMESWFINPTPANMWAERDGVYGSGDRSGPILDLIDRPNAEPANAAAHLRDGLLSGTLAPSHHTLLYEPLDYANGEMQPKSGQGDNYACVWTGKMVIGGESLLQPGWMTFGLGSDDGTVWWIDLDHDGLFEHAGPGQPEELVCNNNWYQGHTQVLNQVEITEAGTYDIALGFFEGGGGDSAEAAFAQGQQTSFAALTHIDPSDRAQLGMWIAPPGFFAESTLELRTDLDANLAELVLKNGDVRITGGSLLTVETASVSPDSQGVVGINTETDTLLTAATGFNGNGVGAVISKLGGRDLILNKDGTGLGDFLLGEGVSTVKLEDGRLICQVTKGDASLGVQPDEVIVPLGDPTIDDDADIEFAGGGLRIEVAGVPIMGTTLREYWFDGVDPPIVIDDASQDEANFGILDEYLGISSTDPDLNISVEPGLLFHKDNKDATTLLDGPLSYRNNADMSSRAGFPGHEYYAGLWHGEVTIPAEYAGVITVGTRSDDGSAAWVKVEDEWELVVNNQGLHGFQEVTGEITLAEGTYEIAFAFYEKTGGDNMEVRLGFGSGLAYGDLYNVDPTNPDQYGLWGPEVAVVGYDREAIDWTAGYDMYVTAGGTLDAVTDYTATFNIAKFSSGILTTQGAGDGIVFNTPTIEADGTSGLNTLCTTYLPNSIDGKSHTAIFVKQGGDDLVITGQGTNLENTTFDAQQGNLVVLSASNPVQDATLRVNGGEITLSMADVATPPDPYVGDYTSNAVSVISDGVLTAGSGGYGETDPGVEKIVELGTAGLNDVALSSGTVELRSTDGYKLNIKGQLTGGGNFEVYEGTVNLDAGGTAGGARVGGGAVTLGADLALNTMALTAGSVDTGGTEGNSVVFGQMLTLGEVQYGIAGGPAKARSSDLATEALIELDTAGSVLTIRGPHVPEGAPADPIGYWSLDGTCADGSGNSHHGTLLGGGVFDGADTGIGSGQCVDLTGVNAYVEVNTHRNPTHDPTQDFFDGGTALSVSVWFKGDTAGWDPVICKNGEQGGWQVRKNGRAASGTDGVDWTTRGVPVPNDATITGNANDNGDFESHGNPFGDGAWHHVVCTYDGTNKAIYIDGALDNQLAVTNPNGTITPVDKILLFGARHNNDYTISEWFDGKIDEVYIYHSGLDQNDVDALYGAGTGPTIGNFEIEQDTTSFRVNEDAEITSPADFVTLGNLELAAGKSLTLSGAYFGFTDLTAGHGSSITGDMSVSGNVRVGSVGTLTFDGELELAEATYWCEVDSTGADLVDNISTDLPIVLGEDATLELMVLESLGLPGCYTERILNAPGAGGIEDDFGTKPAEGDYLAFGVFLDSYANTVMHYDVNLFQADKGDTDGDGDVDLDDLSALDDGWGPTATDRIWTQGDFNGDGDVDLDDLSALDDAWAPAGYPVVNCPFAGGGAGAAAVPEPSTLLLLGMGVICLLAYARRKRRCR